MRLLKYFANLAQKPNPGNLAEMTSLLNLRESLRSLKLRGEMRGDSEALWTLELGWLRDDFHPRSFRFYLMTYHKNILLLFPFFVEQTWLPDNCFKGFVPDPSSALPF
jgi:hypothetical protein